MGARGRTCVACRTVRPKPQLVRIARAPDGRAFVDARGVAPGRGAYVCRDAGCAARISRKLAGALRVPAAGMGAIERELVEVIGA